MPIIAPTYISDRTLPYASDILYHGDVVYSLPVGFHPIELHSVAGFPLYCRNSSVALPKWSIDFCQDYFESTKAALRCIEILEPLREKHVTVVATAYPRGRSAIASARELLRSNPALCSAIEQIDMDPRFLAREVLSHILFEIFLEDGYKGAIAYIQENSATPEKFFELVAAVVANRLRMFCSRKSTLLVYEHSWYPAISELGAIESRNQQHASTTRDDAGQGADADTVEHFTYKLFEAILFPLFGRVTTRERASQVRTLATKHSGAIAALKARCNRIAREVVLMPTADAGLRQQVLTEGITTHISEPLAALLGKPLP